jgi:putative cell wall-binding protein
MQNNFGTKGCMYCEGECNKECLSKEETLEEAAESYAKPFDNRFWVVATFKDGAKWQQENSNVNALHFEIDALKRLVKVLEHQQERMYSKEEVIEFGEMIAWNMVGKTITESFIRTVSKELFEQFKKK